MDMTGLLNYIVPTEEPLRVLVLESALYLRELGELLPNSQLWAVVADGEVARLPEYAGLDVKWVVADYLTEPLPVPEGYFDYIIAERCFELAGNPPELCTALGLYLRDTGYFLSSFQNVRCWKVLQELMQGEFNYGRTRLFSQADYTRLLGSSLFKDVVFTPIRQAAPAGLVERLEQAGFDNADGQLETVAWLVQAARFEPEIMELKRLYTPTDRQQLAKLLRRIEYGIQVADNVRRVQALGEQMGLFPEYLHDFIDHMAFYKERVFTRLVGRAEVMPAARRVGDALGEPLETFDSDHRIAFITCVNDEEWYEECRLYLERLILPETMGAELIPIRGARSMCQGYNQGMKQSQARYKVYVHQDCFIVNENFISDILTMFQADDVGLVGVIGCERLPASGIWWDGDVIYGRVLHACEPEYIMDSEKDNRQAWVQAVDGLLLATQRDVPWREDLFDGWHFYDVAQCMEMQRRGLKIQVPFQPDCWCIHCPKEKPLDPIYYKYQRKFLREYGDEINN